MAEIIVRVVDKVNRDFYLNCRALKRGDVIEVVPDGWPWGVLDQKNPDWRIFKFPGVPVDDLLAFLAPEIDTDPKQPSKTLQPRKFKFDVDSPSLPETFKAALADDMRTNPKVDPAVTMTSPDVWAFKAMKPAVADPAVIGDDPKVIG